MSTRQHADDETGVSTALEVAAAIVDTALPGLGTVGKLLARRSREELRRARSVALKAAERVSGLTREELADAIAQDPRLLPLITRLLHAAGENGYDETLKAMGRAFGEAVKDRDLVDDCHLVLTSLADLGHRHARVLRVLGGNAPLHGTVSQWMAHDVSEAASLPSRSTSLCIAALVARGLVQTGAPFPGGGTMFVITDLGRDVLGLLEEYAAEAAE